MTQYLPQRPKLSKGRPIRGANLRTRLNKVKGLTRDGQNWLVNALDPFHDTDTPLVGYPDLAGDRTVIERIKRSFIVTAAVGFDANIFVLPDMASVNITGYSGTGGVWNINSGGVWNNTWGTVNAIICPTGQSPSIAPGTGTSVANTTFQSNSPPTTMLYGNSRLVAIGVEVINTTAVTSLQGMCTAYKVPQVCSPSTILQQTGNANDFIPPVYTEESRLPPLKIDDAVVYADSKEWEAREGGYISCTQFSIDNPIKITQRGQRVYQDLSNGANSESGFCTYNGAHVTIPTTAVALTYLSFNSSFKSTPFNTHGLYFTGLAANSTLQVDIRYYVEYAPSCTDTSLVSLSRPSAKFDPLAFEIYGRISQRIPAGCPRSWNPLGEWFDTILDAVGNVSSWISPVVPQAAIAAQVAKAVKGIVSSQGTKQIVRAERKLLNKEKKLIKQIKKK